MRNSLDETRTLDYLLGRKHTFGGRTGRPKEGI